MENVAKQNKMGTAKMGPLVFKMAMPAIISMIIQAFYNIVDSIFVARLGDSALTAISLAFPIQMLIISVAVGTGIGLNSLIARRLGEGNKQAADSAATHGVVLTVIGGICFFILGITAIKPFFNAFTDTKAVVEMGVTYTTIVTSLAIFINVSIGIEKMIQGTGNMLMPMVQNLVGAVTNIILDPILIFGLLGAPKMGIAGAAIATVIAQCISMILGIVFLRIRKHSFDIKLKGMKVNLTTVKEIYKVGLPCIVMQMLSSVMIIGLNAILITFSEAAVAVLGIYFRIQTFVFMPVFGLNQGALPIIAYNYGARNLKRIADAYKLTTVSAFLIMLAGLAVFQTIPEKLIRMFIDSPEILSIGVPAFKAISLCFLGAGFGIVNSIVFQAIGRGMHSLLVSLLRQIIIIMPAAYILGKLFGVDAIWYSFPIAEVFAFIVSFAILGYVYKNDLSHMKSE